MNSLEGLIHVWELWYDVGHLFASACCVLAESLAVCGGLLVALAQVMKQEQADIC